MKFFNIRTFFSIFIDHLMKNKHKEILSNINQNSLHSGIEISIIQNMQRSAQRHRKKKREEPIRKAGASYFGQY